MVLCQVYDAFVAPKCSEYQSIIKNKPHDVWSINVVCHNGHARPIILINGFTEWCGWSDIKLLSSDSP